MEILPLSAITTRRNLLVDDHPNITDRRSSEDEEDIIIDPETADFPVEWQVVDRIHGDHIDTVKSILSSYDTSIIERMSWDAIDELGDIVSNIQSLPETDPSLSLLQWCIYYDSKQCFNYILNLIENDYLIEAFGNINSLHFCCRFLKPYYADKILKKWGDNPTYINQYAHLGIYSDSELKITPIMQLFSVDRHMVCNYILNADTDRLSIEDTDKLKEEILNLFKPYSSLNLSLCDDDGNTCYNYLVESYDKDNNLKNILSTFPINY